ncbi:unnamed protein product [Eruca vesicaria subsp. sativa]|uniref:Uncharacterized protein n=1 Tax=Eruca vesicaria subsp. sativa TaxID=29727 RepID=A0ABC8KSK8_ERUVS|nr:unnamed protein product [Eruca vesicaria subsp. sativa]
MRDMAPDLDSFKLSTTRNLEQQAKQIDETLHQIKILLDSKTNSCGSKDNHTIASPPMSSSVNSLTNIAVAAIAVGTMIWIYTRIN